MPQSLEKGKAQPKPVKLLVIGDSGSGKSGALASLALAGYRLRILDMDNGLDILISLLREKPLPQDTMWAGGWSQRMKADTKAWEEAKAHARENVAFETVTDKMRNANGRMIPRQAKAWTRAMTLLDDWTVKDDPENGVVGYSLGKTESWDLQDILVIDSLTFLGHAAVRHILNLNGRLGQQPQLQDWGHAQAIMEDMLAMLYSDDVRCNVVVMSHISYIEVQEITKGYPAAPGKALSPKIGRYFNSMVQIRSIGSGKAVKRNIYTVPQGFLELKHSNPGVVKESYPIETGLADLFADLRG